MNYLGPLKETKSNLKNIHSKLWARDLTWIPFPYESHRNLYGNLDKINLDPIWSINFYQNLTLWVTYMGNWAF